MSNSKRELYIKAMQLIKDDNWNAAHDIIEKMNTDIANLIHAYLHRIEGDNWNANYWYRRAGYDKPNCSIAEEWNTIYKKI